MMLLAHTAQAPGEECGSMMQAAELAVLDWLQAHLRCDFLDAVMPWISRICDHGEIWILLAAVLLLLRKHRWTGMSLSFALILDLICCNIVLKPLVGRIRPFLVNTAVELLTAPPADASFPSGHTAASFAAVFALRGEEPLVLLSMGEKLTIAFQVDGLSCIFAALVSVLWPLASLYAVEYMSREGSENRFFVFYLISFGVTLGIAFSANVLTMYLFYELLTLATLPLVMHHMDGKARYAGRVYLTYSMCGAALGFIAMVLMIEHGAWFFQFGGSVTVTASKENTLRLAYILGFFGFGVKAAVFPGHKWLLRASVAPTPVTALLPAVAVVKAGVFAVARITWYGFGPDLLRGSWCQYLAMGAAMLPPLMYQPPAVVLEPGKAGLGLL
mgnify:CR=1 FL=1